MRHLLAKQEGAKAAVRTIASGASGNERQRELQRDRTRVQTNQVWTGKESTKRNTSIQIHSNTNNKAISCTWSYSCNRPTDFINASRNSDLILNKPLDRPCQTLLLAYSRETARKSWSSSNWRRTAGIMMHLCLPTRWFCSTCWIWLRNGNSKAETVQLLYTARELFPSYSSTPLLTATGCCTDIIDIELSNMADIMMFTVWKKPGARSF